MLPTQTAYCSAIPQCFPIAFTVLSGDGLCVHHSRRRSYGSSLQGINCNASPPSFCHHHRHSQVSTTLAFHRRSHYHIVTRRYEGKGQAEALPYPRPSQRPGGLVAGAVVHGLIPYALDADPPCSRDATTHECGPTLPQRRHHTCVSKPPLIIVSSPSTISYRDTPLRG